jgi:hypothetical protein
MKAPRLPPKDYKPEFRELGLEKVRSELLMRRWDPEKLAAARIWVENQDTQQWLAGRGDEPPRMLRTKELRKWAMYIVSAIGVAYAAARILKTLRWGG